MFVSLAFAETNTTATLLTIERGDPVGILTATQTATPEYKQPILIVPAATTTTEQPQVPNVEIQNFSYNKDTGQLRIVYTVTADTSTAYVYIYGIGTDGTVHVISNQDKPTNTQLDETYSLDFSPTEIYITAITNAVSGVTPWVLEVLAPEAVTPNRGIITVPVLMRAAVPINIKVVNGYYVEELNPSTGMFRIPIVPAVGATFVRVKVVPASPAVVTVE